MGHEIPDGVSLRRGGGRKPPRKTGGSGKGGGSIGAMAWVILGIPVLTVLATVGYIAKGYGLL